VKWPLVSLGDALASAHVFVDGDWVESKDQDPEGDVRLIQLADVGDGQYVDKSERYLTAAKARELKCTFLETGDVLVARMPDPLGRACIFPGDPMPTVTVVDVCIIRPNGNGPDSRWLVHWFNSPAARNQIATYATGTTRSRISRGNLSKLKLALPPLTEQRRIAEILDEADALRAMRRAALAQLETLSRSIFLHMFGDSFWNPRNWPMRRLHDVCEQINDCPHSTPAWKPEGVVCLRTSNLTTGGWDWEDTRFVSEAEYVERSRRGYLAAGDIVLSREGTVGIAAIVEPGMKVCMGQRLVQIRPSSDLVNVSYLLLYLLRVLNPTRLAQAMVGSTSQHLNVRELKALLIPVPPLDLQRDFARRLRQLQNVSSANGESLAEFDALFTSLQHRAFRGEL
jgi:type I restriction enzyme S subunit